MTPFILVSCLSAAENGNRLFSRGRNILTGLSADVRLHGRAHSLTCVVGERPAVVVEDEPALLPGLYLAAHFDEEAPTGFVSDGQVEAGVRAVPGRLDVAAEIKVVFPHREVAAKQPRLRKADEGKRRRLCFVQVFT